MKSEVMQSEMQAFPHGELSDSLLFTRSAGFH